MDDDMEMMFDTDDAPTRPGAKVAPSFSAVADECVVVCLCAGILINFFSYYYGLVNVLGSGSGSVHHAPCSHAVTTTTARSLRMRSLMRSRPCFVLRRCHNWLCVVPFCVISSMRCSGLV